MSSNAEWYIGHAVVELLVQERVVSMFSVIDILERRLQSGDSSKDEFMEILETGADILCRVAFKPTATIGQVQKTASRDGENGTLEMNGRHDPCVALRAPVIVESMAALVLVDLFLEQRARGNLF